VVAVSAAWPAAGLDPIARLRVLSAALPGTVVHEDVFDAPFDRVWARVTDFEQSVPAFDVDVARVRILDRRAEPGGGESLRIVSHQTARALWLPARLDIDLAAGWCWMVSRPQLYVIGMAAEPVPGPGGERTHFAHMEGVAVPAPAPLRPLLQPVLAVSRWRHRRHVPRDVAGIRRLAEAGE
jgi:hypothetical protein